MKRRMSLLATLLSATALLALAAFSDIAKAEPPSGVTPTLLARGTYNAFNVQSAHQGPIAFTAEAKAPMDIVVRRHDYAPHSTTGWHSHPGPVFITVTQGTLTYYDYADPTCTPRTVSVGEGFVDDGHGHVVRNESDQPAQDVSVIIAPVGGPFRTDLAVPTPDCAPRGAPLSTPVTAPALPLPATGAEAAAVLFPKTGYSLDGEFLRYWQAHGGLSVFGYPIESAHQSDGQVSQWLERARFELHPEQQAPYHVLLSRLGVEALQHQSRPWQRLPKASPSAAHYFKETGHAISYGPFWSYWASHGLEFDGRAGTSFAESLALFGYPISEAALERNTSGDVVLTQWFERARFEYHPENPAAYRVLLGRLGADLRAVRQR